MKKPPINNRSPDYAPPKFPVFPVQEKVPSETKDQILSDPFFAVGWIMGHILGPILFIASLYLGQLLIALLN